MKLAVLKQISKILFLVFITARIKIFINLKKSNKYLSNRSKAHPAENKNTEQFDLLLVSEISFMQVNTVNYLFI